MLRTFFRIIFLCAATRIVLGPALFLLATAIQNEGPATSVPSQMDGD